MRETEKGRDTLTGTDRNVRGSNLKKLSPFADIENEGEWQVIIINSRVYAMDVVRVPKFTWIVLCYKKKSIKLPSI